MNLKEYSPEQISAQPAGAWTGMAYRLVVGALRDQLAVEDLTQPHWWTLNHAAGDPGRWTRAALIERLTPYDDMDTDFHAVFDNLVDRGWLLETGGTMSLTEEGVAGRERAKQRNLRVLERTHEGVDPQEYVTTINVLRRIVANMGGDGNLPE
ncbi:MarR family transcriptional regulator [Streptomyces sp. CAU 1734]|uniref:MarR family transcriptional regulator n=1 Tax=Streptomyces sp. CAU 1734 TaxID=3140360 RepID=UPI00326167A5